MYETNESTNEARDADVAGVARLICGNLIEREMPRTTIYEHLDAGSASTTFRSHARPQACIRGEKESVRPIAHGIRMKGEMFISERIVSIVGLSIILLTFTKED